MSHAPAHRKSARALASATAKAASRRPAPHQVVLRIKRKRCDAAVESLLVAANEESVNKEAVMPDRKRSAGTIEEKLSVLSLSKAVGREQAVVPPAPRLYYKRARTTDSAGRVKQEEADASPCFPGQAAELEVTRNTGAIGEGRRLDALMSKVKGSTTLRAPAVLDYLEVRRVRARGVDDTSGNPDSAGSDRPRSSPLSGATPAGGAAVDVHVIDLKPVRRSDTKDMDIGRIEGGTCDGAGARPAAPVLSPVERQMDEAIFTAFQTGNLSSVREILASYPSIVNYRRRLGDGTTALMAAAFHGDVDSIRYLLSLDAKAYLVDAGDKSAALFAGMRGHHQCFAELQCVADEESALSTLRRGEGGGGRDDFVYDLYYFEPSEPQGLGLDPAAGWGGSMSDDQAGGAVSTGTSFETNPAAAASAPVVRLSGIGPVDVNAVGTTAGMDLKFEHDSDWSELGDEDEGEDPDSNSEGFYGNDYPEDEGVGDGAEVPYNYDGSSCASEDGSSSDDGRLDSDDDMEYPRRVLECRLSP